MCDVICSYGSRLKGMSRLKTLVIAPYGCCQLQRILRRQIFFCIFFMNMNLTVPFLNIYVIEYVSNIYTAELSERTRSSTLLIIHWNFLDLMCVDFRASRTWLKEVEKKVVQWYFVAKFVCNMLTNYDQFTWMFIFFLSNKNVKKEKFKERKM